MNRSQFRAAYNRAYLRRLLVKPATAIRMSILRMGLKTISLESLIIESIPTYRSGIPQKSLYHICLRSPNGRGRLVADVEIHQCSFQEPGACRINIIHADLPSHAMNTPWTHMDMDAPSQ